MEPSSGACESPSTRKAAGLPCLKVVSACLGLVLPCAAAGPRPAQRPPAVWGCARAGHTWHSGGPARRAGSRGGGCAAPTHAALLPHTGVGCQEPQPPHLLQYLLWLWLNSPPLICNHHPALCPAAVPCLAFFRQEVDSPVKATDFGLSIRHRPEDHPLKSRSGTPAYMAPEVRQLGGHVCFLDFGWAWWGSNTRDGCSAEAQQPGKVESSGRPTNHLLVCRPARPCAPPAAGHPAEL